MSRAFENQLRYARLIASTVEEHREVVAKTVAARQVSDSAHAIKAAHVSALMVALAGQLSERTSAYEAARRLALQETEEDSAALRRLEAAVVALREKLSEAIAFLNTSFDAGLLSTARLDAPLEPVLRRDALIERASYAVTYLKAHPVESQNAFGFKLSTQPIVDTLEPLLEEALTARDALTQDQRQTLLARQERDAAEVDFWLTLTQSASIIESFMRLSGHTLLADRLRPTQRRVRGDINVEEEVPSMDDAPNDPSVP